jgi:hypothetical protein
VIGLIADSLNNQLRELRLVVHGEPWSASASGPVCNLAAHVFSGLPAGTFCWFYMGVWSDTPTVIPPCSSWLTSASLIGSGSTDAYGMLRFPIAVSPGLVHAEFGLQALLLPGSGWLMSNALRVHVGGGL